MRTTTIVFIVVIAVLNGLNNAQAIINGAWTTYYGGNFYICANNDTGEVNGVYSEQGYIQGYASGSSVTGDWFSAGLNVADLNGRCCTPNRGTFQFSFATNSFTGSYLFEEIAKGGESWSGTRKSSIAPSSSQCWSPKENLTESLNGQWASSVTTAWDQCIDTNGQWTVSYEYGAARTRGYVYGKCFYNGQFCHGDWFEPNKVSGGYMVRMLANNEMATTWWQFNASDITSTTYSRYAANSVYHATETLTRQGVTPVSCSRNSDLFFIKVASTVTPYDYSPYSSYSTPLANSSIDTTTIIFVAVGIAFGNLIVLIVTLRCLVCPGRFNGGGGGGGWAGTRRHGFGRTHHRFGGGYS